MEVECSPSGKRIFIPPEIWLLISSEAIRPPQVYMVSNDRGSTPGPGAGMVGPSTIPLPSPDQISLSSTCKTLRGLLKKDANIGSAMTLWLQVEEDQIGDEWRWIGMDRVSHPAYIGFLQFFRYMIDPEKVEKLDTRTPIVDVPLSKQIKHLKVGMKIMKPPEGYTDEKEYIFEEACDSFAKRVVSRVPNLETLSLCIEFEESYVPFPISFRLGDSLSKLQSLNFLDLDHMVIPRATPPLLSVKNLQVKECHIRSFDVFPHIRCLKMDVDIWALKGYRIPAKTLQQLEIFHFFPGDGKQRAKLVSDQCQELAETRRSSTNKDDSLQDSLSPIPLREFVINDQIQDNENFNVIIEGLASPGLEIFVCFGVWNRNRKFPTPSLAYRMREQEAPLLKKIREAWPNLKVNEFWTTDRWTEFWDKFNEDYPKSDNESDEASDGSEEGSFIP